MQKLFCKNFRAFNQTLAAGLLQQYFNYNVLGTKLLHHNNIKVALKKIGSA